MKGVGTARFHPFFDVKIFTVFESQNKKGKLIQFTCKTPCLS